jgi:hypothetical protein
VIFNMLKFRPQSVNAARLRGVMPGSRRHATSHR